jgi:hypothetical protein
MQDVNQVRRRRGMPKQWTGVLTSNWRKISASAFMIAVLSGLIVAAAHVAVAIRAMRTAKSTIITVLPRACDRFRVLSTMISG